MSTFIVPGPFEWDQKQILLPLSSWSEAWIVHKHKPTRENSGLPKNANPCWTSSGRRLNAKFDWQSLPFTNWWYLRSHSWPWTIIQQSMWHTWVSLSKLLTSSCTALHVKGRADIKAKLFTRLRPPWACPWACSWNELHVCLDADLMTRSR